MKRSKEIAINKIRRLAHDAYDDCIGIARQNDMQKLWALEEFERFFLTRRLKEREGEGEL